jgi:hypothetical protein
MLYFIMGLCTLLSILSRLVSKTVLHNECSRLVLFYTLYCNMFRPIWWPSSGESYKILKEVATNQKETSVINSSTISVQIYQYNTLISRYTQRSHALSNIKTWKTVSNSSINTLTHIHIYIIYIILYTYIYIQIPIEYCYRDNINKPKKSGSIEGSPYT